VERFLTRLKEREMRTSWRMVLGAMALVVVGVTVAACGGGGGGSGGGGNSIALLLPESKTTRYESQDRPHFEQKVKDLCSDCKILYSNANQDPAAQQQQAEAALTNGADVLVLDPVDAASAGSIVAEANRQNVPVISYDRLVTNSDIAYYVSFDNVRVGKLQARTLLNRLRARGQRDATIVMINGAPTDNNATQFKQGANSVFKNSGLKIGKSYDTPDWSPDQAQDEMQQAITALGKSGFAGVYAANDGTAGGAIAAMRGAGINPRSRPTTGQDAELAGIQRILVGDQYMTVYKAVKPEAETAAEVAVALAKGDKIPTDLVNKHVSNGSKQVPARILTPVAVTKSNIKDTVIKDGFWTVFQICTGRYAKACNDAGLE
jgi:D-xylose transport system substrate-binding protein